MANNNVVEINVEQDASEYRRTTYSRIRKMELGFKWVVAVLTVMAIAGAFLLMF